MEDELDDAAAWVERSRKRQKRLASEEEEQRKRKEKEQKESKQQYTDKDIVGLRVAHDIDDVMDQDETILVLKDSSVLDGGDEDGNIELVSVGLLEKERLRENAENKSKKVI